MKLQQDVVLDHFAPTSSLRLSGQTECMKSPLSLKCFLDDSQSYTSSDCVLASRRAWMKSRKVR